MMPKGIAAVIIIDAEIKARVHHWGRITLHTPEAAGDIRGWGSVIPSVRGIKAPPSNDSEEVDILSAKTG